VLGRLSDFVNSTAHDYFATMLCVLIDVRARRLTVASAGHIAPLLLDGEQAEFVELEANVPIGVPRRSPYQEASVAVPAKSTLIAFTDGLVERRGESLDVGLSRLRDAATDQLLLEDLLRGLSQSLTSQQDHDDDIAIVAVRWQR
jgi:serine phosphatase RsbU (regulator of sigma subunit)